jgi:hypothetical protein
MITQRTHLEIWNAASGEKIKAQDLESSTPKMVLLQAPYLVELACNGEQLEISLFLLKQGLLSHVRSGFIRSESLPAGVAMHPKGAAIVLLNRDASLVGLDLRSTISTAVSMPAMPGEGVCAIAYGTQGRMMAAGHEDGTVSLVRSGNFKLLHTCSGDSSEPISKLLFSPGDEWLVAHHKGGFLSCFQLSGDPTIPGFTHMVAHPILWMEFHPVQHRLMVLTAEEVLLLNLHLRRADGVVGVGPTPLVAVAGRENGDVMGLTDNGSLVRLQMPEELL